jgi:hypothetical protein
MYIRGVLILLLLLSSLAYAEPILIPDMVNVKASLRQTPPDWAVMERKLIDVMENEAAPLFIEKFTRPDGQTYGGGPYDDVYEMFYNWSLFYAMGGDEKIFQWALKEYNAITDQCTTYYQDKRDYYHQLYKEFPENDDFFHIGEGMMLFYDLPIGNPAIPQNIDRAKRFAGFYLGEDPEAKSNYDSKLKIIRSTYTGSRGASDTGGGAWILANNAASLLPIVKQFDKGWEEDPVKRAKMYKIYDDVVRRCDIPTNLSATALITNAYLYTGEEKYKKWVLEYVEAWMQHIKDNKGIIPDNIGRSGKIGEYRNGQFWGGLWGWYPRGYMTDFGFGAMTIASECAYLVSGDPKYLDLIRSQIDVLMENSKTSPEGEMLVPATYGPDGWGNFAPKNIRELAHLWHASMDPKDWARIEKVKKNAKLDWKNVPVIRDRNVGNSDYARLLYYSGEKPDWPYEALKADYQWVINQMEYLLNDKKDIFSVEADWLLYSNPLATKALQQVTMGAPQTMYHGGLLRATVRYYDMDKIRPGLPEDVAALVKELGKDRAVIELANLSTKNTRKLIVQAGAFGEHNFTNVSYKDNVIVDFPEKITSPITKETKDRTAEVNGKYFSVEMPPGTFITLEIGMQRFVNKPSYAFPWHGGIVPVK